jgi:SAM-dependent methyltransferase
MYRNVNNFLKKLNFNRTLDLACGSMQLYDKIKTNNYLAVDIDPIELQIGSKKHQQAKYKLSSIEDFETKKKFDLVVCLQTLGINSKFNLNNFDMVMKKISKLVVKNGYLVINLGPLIAKLEMDSVLQKYILRKYYFIKVINYGVFDKHFDIFWYRIILFLYKFILFFNYFAKKKYLLIIAQRII